MNGYANVNVQVIVPENQLAKERKSIAASRDRGANFEWEILAANKPKNMLSKIQSRFIARESKY